MNGMDYRKTAILTEHFGFPPLALIDDVINAVNHIMYKCTQAMENYLNERKQKQQEELETKGGSQRADWDRELEGASSDEIAVGTGKLETLLESQVDKNFDKFELYALRNIFTIPSDLFDEGRIRLKHHEGLVTGVRDDQDISKAVQELVHAIGAELNLRKLLKLQIAKANKLVSLLEDFKRCLEFLGSESENMSPEGKQALRAISPIDENLYFLLKQTDDLISQVSSMHYKFSHDSTEFGMRNIQFAPTVRDAYIQGKSYKLLESIGVLEPDNLQGSESANQSDPTEQLTSADTEAAKKINEKLDSVNSV
ncbi:Piso0_005244 [Millerozyma farinosa CBS 7064]|uniref:Piso0_005244 protein n=1 Tax=Pichia sorbitophila (strain ATCC MYA-4447 / BCRC 22081 / CBS 7064 / NBRC 10061 / NRRL Y-12695) TaxID=559304 RepID=G8Y4L0_PICSO|nr:Piso0_005244 [Millerozyma farinosa CBS 7064]